MINKLSTKVYVGGVMALALVLGIGGQAFATDPVSDAFTSGQTSLSGYITEGIGVIVAVLLLGLGVGLLVKYLRKAVRAA